MALNKELLSGFGLSEEAITQIMAEHGKSIQAEQSKANLEKEKAKTALEQLTEANNKLTNYDAEWQKKMEDSETSYKSKIASLEFNYALDSALQESGARNIKAVKALISNDGLVHKDGKIIGLDEQLEAIKKDNDYLFKSAEQEKPQSVPIFTKNINAGASNTLGEDKKAKANAAFRAAFRTE